MAVLRRLIAVSGALFVAAAVVIAQPAREPWRLSLADAVALALAANHDLAQQRTTLAILDAQGDRAQGAYDPVVRLDSRGRVRTDPINSLLSGAPDGALAPRVTSLGTSASYSRLFGDGSSLTASAGVSRDTSNGRFALLSPSWLSSVSAEFRRPLAQGRDIDAARRVIRITAIDRSRGDATLRRLTLDIVASVERAYWTLVAARRDEEIRRRALTLAEDQRVDVQSRIESGVTPESEIASPIAEIERRRGDLFVSRDRVSRAEQALKTLVMAEATDARWMQDAEPSDTPDEDARPAPAYDDAVTTALATRPEIAEARAFAARQDVEIAFARDRVRPSIDLVASYALRGLAGGQNGGASFPFGAVPIIVPDDQDGAFFQSMATLFMHRFVDASVGVTVTVPLGNRAAHADVAVAELSRTQTDHVIAQIGVRIAADVRNAIVAIETASQRVRTAGATIEAARVQLQAERDRVDAGLTTSFFVLTRQNDLALAELAESAARADVRLAWTELARATGTLLQQRGIEIK